MCTVARTTLHSMCMLTVILIMSCMGICELCICNILTQNHLSAFHFSVDVYGCILDAFDSGKSCAVLNFIVSWCHYVIGHYTLILVHRWQFQNRMQLNNNNVSVLVIEFYFLFFLERGIRAKRKRKPTAHQSCEQRLYISHCCMNDAFQYKRLYRFNYRIKNKALAVFGMCVCMLNEQHCHSFWSTFGVHLVRFVLVFFKGRTFNF